MKRLRAQLWSLALVPCFTLVSATAQAKPVEEEVRAMIGREHAPAHPETSIFDDLTCVDHGFGTLVIKGRQYEGWGTSLSRCQGNRFVMMLEKRVREGKTVDESRWRVMDAYLLPEVVGIQIEPDKPEGPYLFTPEACRLGGDTKGTDFYSVVRLSKSSRIDWRTGLLGAWGYDMKQQRIVALDVKRVVCHKPGLD